MESGILIKSTKFHTSSSFVVLCDNKNISGNRSGELPIDAPSFNFHPWATLEGKRIEFELVELGDNKSMNYYARIKQQ